MRGAVDQAAHWTLGYLMARSLRGLTAPDDVVKRVMAFAEAREWLQHPGGAFGAGSDRDLKWWRRGALRGARA